MFWGVRLSVDCRLGPIRAKNNFKVSNATLDLTTVNNDGVVSVWVAVDRNHTLLANLSQNKSQSQIDVAFGNVEMPEFYLQSTIPATVYLSGYYIIDDDIEIDNDDANSCTAGNDRNDSFLYPPGNQMQSLKRKLNTTPIVSNVAYNAYGNIFDNNKVIVPSVREEKHDESDDETFPGVFDSSNAKKKPKLESASPQNLEGGVKIEDVTKGCGKVIGKSSTVTIKYTVSPVSSNLRSNPTESKVTLSGRKVLECWKLGIPGMKVGGVRKITSPPSHAYGTTGIPPFINGDTTVVFEVLVLNCLK